jgi:hypothetical protein
MSSNGAHCGLSGQCLSQRNCKPSRQYGIDSADGMPNHWSPVALGSVACSLWAGEAHMCCGHLVARKAPRSPKQVVVLFWICLLAPAPMPRMHRQALRQGHTFRNTPSPTNLQRPRRDPTGCSALVVAALGAELNTHSKRSNSDSGYRWPRRTAQPRSCATLPARWQRRRGTSGRWLAQRSSAKSSFGYCTHAARVPG